MAVTSFLIAAAGPRQARFSLPVTDTKRGHASRLWRRPQTPACFVAAALRIAGRQRGLRHRCGRALGKAISILRAGQAVAVDQLGHFLFFLTAASSAARRSSSALAAASASWRRRSASASASRRRRSASAAAAASASRRWRSAPRPPLLPLQPPGAGARPPPPRPGAGAPAPPPPRRAPARRPPPPACSGQAGAACRHR